MGHATFKVRELIENRYRVLSVVGSGWMGSVYRVSDETRSGEVLALKTVRVNRPQSEIAESVAHFQREFQLLARLRHPNLVSVYDYGAAGGGDLYFTMEWIEGQPLKASKPLLEPAAIVPLMVQACRALAYLHSRGVIHGNLKPSHVLITGDAGRQVKIVDFGVALEARSTYLHSPFYTPYYSAPEVVEQRPVDHRADLYSLGALWYELLTGEPPQFMPGPGRERLIALTLEDALEARQQSMPGISSVIAQMLATSPPERYASADKVIEAVNKAIGGDYALETRETASSYALRAQFINRQVEIETLQALWRQAQSTESQLVLIGGETGVGKTRLLEELKLQAELGGARVVRGQCVEQGGGAYQPWREVLRVLVRYMEGTHLTILQRLGPVLATVLPELWKQSYMAGYTPPAALDAPAAQQRLNNAIVHLLYAAAESRPTIVVIENAHWADEATLALLNFLERIPGRAGLLVCLTYRTDEIDPDHPLATLTGERLHRIKVGRLLPEATAHLVGSMLGLSDVPALLIKPVQQATGGNALFVQELIRSLAEDGVVLQRSVEGWQIDHAALQAAHLPESVRQVVRRRLEHAPSEVRQVLSWAALVGVRFWEDVVAEVGQAARSWVRATLRQAVEQELALERDESAFAGEREYGFSAAAVREQSYALLSPQERLDGHKRAAAWLMAYSDDQAGELVGLIADHLEKAGQPTQAVAYLRRAGEQAARQFANAEALAYFDRALNLMPPEALAERYDLLLGREGVYHLQAAREAQQRDLASLQDLAEKLDDGGQPSSRRQAQLALRQAHYAWATSNYPATIAAAQTAIDLARRADSADIEADGYLQWGQALWRLGDFEVCRTRLEQSLEVARTALARQLEADSLRILGNVCYYLGDYAGAMTYWLRSLPISREIGNRPGEASALSNLGEAARSQGNYAQAKAYYEQRLRICRETGERYGEGIALINMSLVSHNLGDNRTALEYGQQALQLAQKTENRTQQAYALTNMGHALEGLGLLKQATDAYQRAVTLRQELGERHLAMESIAGLARVDLAQDNVVQAQAVVEDILKHLENDTLDGTEEPLKVYTTCYRVLRASNDPRAQAILRMAYHVLQETAAKISDEALHRSFLEEVDVHRQIAQEFALLE